ncbi:hypothetical protein AOLI_G00178590 [Acnodon oligacanthus]
MSTNSSLNVTSARSVRASAASSSFPRLVVCPEPENQEVGKQRLFMTPYKEEPALQKSFVQLSSLVVCQHEWKVCEDDLITGRLLGSQRMSLSQD